MGTGTMQNPEGQHALLRQPFTSNALQALPGHGVADRLGGDRGGVQDLDQAASVLFRDALERRRRTNDPEFARLVAYANSMGSVLAQA